MFSHHRKKKAGAQHGHTSYVKNAAAERECFVLIPPLRRMLMVFCPRHWKSREESNVLLYNTVCRHRFHYFSGSHTPLRKKGLSLLIATLITP